MNDKRKEELENCVLFERSQFLIEIGDPGECASKKEWCLFRLLLWYKTLASLIVAHYPVLFSAFTRWLIMWDLKAIALGTKRHDASSHGWCNMNVLQYKPSQLYLNWPFIMIAKMPWCVWQVWNSFSFIERIHLDRWRVIIAKQLTFFY